MHPNQRRRIGGRSVRRLAFGARAVTRSMGRSRPSLQRCAGQPTNVCERAMQRYGSNDSSARLEASGGSTVGDAASGLLSPQKTRVRARAEPGCSRWSQRSLLKTFIRSARGSRGRDHVTFPVAVECRHLIVACGAEVVHNDTNRVHRARQLLGYVRAI